MDVEILARIQFAFTVGFHYIFPPMSIGLGLLMVIYESLFLKTKNKEYETLARFWTKIFGLTFVFGVATGIVMEFEFGTNWARYSRFVGDVFGSALAAEGAFAFAIESTFLGILIFGWNRTKPIVHLISTIGVFLGSMISAIWILVANSWQQTPAGFHVVGEGSMARAEITHFWAMVFNPSSLDRISHVWLGAFLTGAFFVLSVHAYYIVKGKFIEISKRAFVIALIVATVFSLSQLVSGHSSANGVAKNQPAKLAALEGHYETTPGDLYILGWVDNEKQEVTGIKIPGGLSYLLHYDFTTPVTGLNEFAKEDQPSQVNAIFQSYHIMVVIGLFFICITLFAWFMYWRKKLYSTRWLLLVFVFAAILPQFANQFGWIAAELGRQPWVVYGLLRTSEAFSATVGASQVLFSIIMFLCIYLILLVLFVYLLIKKIKHGPYNESQVATPIVPTV